MDQTKQTEQCEANAKMVQKELIGGGLHGNFCPIPFTTLILEPDGQVGSCRMKGSDFPVGNIREQNFWQIWNGEIIRNWRQEFLQNNINICSREIRHQLCHLCPENKNLLAKIVPIEVQPLKVVRLGLNVNSLCNLKCQMCWIWQKPNGLYDKLNFWEMIETEILPFLDEIEMFSGEPFVQRDTYRLFKIVANINPCCRWTLTTNGHWKFNGYIKKHLDMIKIKNFIISLDSLDPKTYSKIRRGGKLSLVLKNVEKIVNYRDERLNSKQDNIGLKINFLVQRDNWQELGEMIDFGNQRHIPTYRAFLYEPFQYSLLSLSSNECYHILRYYLAKYNWDKLSLSMRVIIPLLDKLSPLDKKEIILAIDDKRKKTVKL